MKSICRGERERTADFWGGWIHSAPKWTSERREFLAYCCAFGLQTMTGLDWLAFYFCIPTGNNLKIIKTKEILIYLIYLPVGHHCTLIVLHMWESKKNKGIIIWLF